MESVNLQGSNYNNIYKNKQAAENTNVSFQGKTKDSFEKKYKHKKNNTAAAIGKIALIAIGAVAAFKNKDKIGSIANKIKTKGADVINSAKTKCPNVSDAMSSIKKACDKPINAVKKFGSKTVNSAKTKIGNLHIKKA